jgi:hypothetical protein
MNQSPKNLLLAGADKNNKSVMLNLAQIYN